MSVIPKPMINIRASSHLLCRQIAFFALHYQLAQFCAGFCLVLPEKCGVILFRAKPRRNLQKRNVSKPV